MSTRYVWGKNTYTWALGAYTDVYTAPWDKFSSYPDPSASYKITSTGKYQLGSGSGGSLTMSILTGKDTPPSNWYQKYLIGGSGDYLAEQLTNGTFWCRAGSSYIAQGSASGDVVNPDPNDPSSTSYYRAKFRLYGPAEAQQGTRVGYVSAATSTGYPQSGVSGDYFYTYLGSDNIDPTAVSYSDSPQAGNPVTVTVTPRSNTYGGTISYQYQYSTDGGTSWTDTGAKTSDTSKAITIPAAATQFRARVLASDDMGFTSTTYVTGANLTLNSAPTAPASVTVPAVVAPGQEFTVSWAASTDPDGNLSGYQVERSYNGGTTWTSVDSAVGGTSLDTTVAAGNTAVLFRVRAFDSGGLYSGWTVSQSVEINSPPTAPGNVTIGTVTYGDYTELSWTASTDTDGSISGYTLQRSVNGGTFETVYTGSALSYTDQTENWNWTTVQYRVQAQDDRGGLSDWTTSPQRQVQPGTLSITGDPESPGQVVKSFTFTASVTPSGQFPVSGILVVMTLDGEEKVRTTVNSGGEASLPTSIDDLASGSHTITVAASRDKFTTATEFYSFTVVPIELGAGGRLERLENSQGDPVYPIAILEGIFRKQDGKALAEILSDLNGGDGGTDLTIQATAETLPAGSQATVTVTQTGTDVLLHFGIPEGAQGATGPAGVDGATGPQGAPGVGVPSGGSAGQVLAKKTAQDYDTEWIDPPESGESSNPDCVSSFNGRIGAVTTQSGDYTAEMVGAIPNTTVAAVVVQTEAEYEALTTKSTTTLYLVKE